MPEPHSNRCPRCGDALLTEDKVCARCLAGSLYPELRFDAGRSSQALHEGAEIRTRNAVDGGELGAQGGESA